MKKKHLLSLPALLCAFLCAFGLAACNTTIAVESVTLNKSELTMEIYDIETLTATVTPGNATNKAVIWSVAPEGIVTVDNGKITAISAGIATVTATAEGKSATCSVTVDEPVPTYEVTAEQWVQILDSATNYTIETNTKGSSKTWTQKIDGDMFELFGTEHQIFAKDDGNYYIYTEIYTSWERNMTLNEYGELVLKQYSLAKYFKDNYSAFTYADGKYTAEAVDKTADDLGVCENVTVTFKNGALTCITFEKTNTYETVEYKVINVGTSAIELPTNYVEYEEE